MSVLIIATNFFPPLLWEFLSLLPSDCMAADLDLSGPLAGHQVLPFPEHIV